MAGREVLDEAPLPAPAEVLMTAVLADVRTLIDDAHHGLRQRRLRGDADAIAHTISRALEVGVPNDECARLAIEEFRSLLQQNRRRVHRWKGRARLAKTPALPDVSPPNALSEG